MECLVWLMFLASICCIVFLFGNIITANGPNRKAKALTSLRQQVYNAGMGGSFL